MSYINKLNNEFIEKAESIDFVDEILLASEVGSRSMNLDHENSDYDIKVVFKQKDEDYVLIGRHRSSIEQQELIKDWEIEGWNIDKFAELSKKSNPSLIEFLQSPIVYCKNESVHSTYLDLKKYILSDPNLIGLYKTYISQAKHNYRQYIKKDYEIKKKRIFESKYSEQLNSNNNIYIDDEKLILGDKEIYIDEALENSLVRETETERTVKRNLFIIRAICCAKWIRLYKTLPPIDFVKLVNKQEFLDNKEENKIREIIELKKKDNNKLFGNPLEKVIKQEIETDIENSTYDSGQFEIKDINNYISEIYKN